MPSDAQKIVKGLPQQELYRKARLFRVFHPVRLMVWPPPPEWSDLPAAY